MSQSTNLYNQLARNNLFSKSVNFDLKRIKLILKKLNHPERKLKNVIFSPHRAGALDSAFKEMGELVIQDLKLISKGLPPRLCKKAERETVKFLRSKPVDIN